MTGRKARSRTLLAGLAVAVGAACPAAGAGPREPPGVDTALLRSVFAEMAAGGRFAGTAVVSKDRRIVFRASIGLANRERRIPNTIRTQYRFNSLTTIFTAVAVAQLQDRGRLRLDASICRYVPRCPRPWRPITVEMLFGPATGLRRLAFRAPPTVADYVEALRRERLHFAPGTKWPRANPKLSSGPSPEVLAVYVLERVAGESWLRYVRRNVLRRAGMTDTELDVGRPPTRALGYVYDRSRRPVPAPNTTLRATVTPDVLKGLRGSALDFIRFEHALTSGRLVSAKGFAFLSTISLPQERARGIGWSCCWLVGRTPEGEPIHLHGAHSGLPDGFYSGFHRYPASNVTAAFFTNMGGNAPVWSGLETFGMIARGLYPQARSVEASALREYAGAYAGTGHTIRGRRLEAPRVTVTAGRRSLTLSVPAAGDWISSDWFSTHVRLMPLEDDEFFDRLDPNQRFRFERDSAGRVAALVATNLKFRNWQERLRRVR